MLGVATMNLSTITKLVVVGARSSRQSKRKWHIHWPVKKAQTLKAKEKLLAPLKLMMRMKSLMKETKGTSYSMSHSIGSAHNVSLSLVRLSKGRSLPVKKRRKK